MLLFGKKVAKISQVDPEIIVLRAIIKEDIKKKEMNASKIYSPSGKFAEQAKLVSVIRNMQQVSLNCKFLPLALFFCFAIFKFVL